MKKFGLIGFPLTHSFSKKYFSEKFSKAGNKKLYSYENYEMESLSGLRELIASDKNLLGLNVTIPHKEKVLPFIDEIFSPAKEIGAINTIKIIRQENDIKLLGYNTDVIGFEAAITPLLDENHHGAIILGTGGASKAVAYVLNKMKIEFISVSRTKSENTYTYREITKALIEKYPVIINTTPAGTFPLTTDAPSFPYSLLSPDNLLFDLVYNPYETLFMQKGIEHGADVSNGYSMLVAQAEAAWKIWISKSAEK